MSVGPTYHLFLSLLFLSPTRAAPTVRRARSAGSNPPRGAGGDARVLSAGWRCRGSCWCGGAGGRPRRAVAVGDEARRGKPRGHAAPSPAPSAGGLHGAGAEADAGGRLDHSRARPSTPALWRRRRPTRMMSFSSSLMSSCRLKSKSEHSTSVKQSKCSGSHEVD